MKFSDTSDDDGLRHQHKKYSIFRDDFRFFFANVCLVSVNSQIFVKLFMQIKIDP